MLHDNGFRDLLTDGQAGVANHANDALLGADQPDLLVFREADLSEALTDFRRARELANTHPLPGFDLVEGAKRRSRATLSG